MADGSSPTDKPAVHLERVWLARNLACLLLGLRLTGEVVLVALLSQRTAQLDGHAVAVEHLQGARAPGPCMVASMTVVRALCLCLQPKDACASGSCLWSCLEAHDNGPYARIHARGHVCTALNY